LLAHPAKLEDMRTRAKALGRPDAACRVLDTVLGKAEI
jgi:processive 1,2-diacylglycerol beta-glucosyltransferase